MAKTRLANDKWIRIDILRFCKTGFDAYRLTSRNQQTKGCKALVRLKCCSIGMQAHEVTCDISLPFIAFSATWKSGPECPWRMSYFLTPQSTAAQMSTLIVPSFLTIFLSADSFALLWSSTYPGAEKRSLVFGLWKTFILSAHLLLQAQTWIYTDRSSQEYSI